MKVKKEKKEGELYGDESDESDWEPEADVTPVQRENRSGRQRKRPSFFQEFESQENNLDSILAEFEQTQVKTSLKILTFVLSSYVLFRLPSSANHGNLNLHLKTLEKKKSVKGKHRRL